MVDIDFDSEKELILERTGGTAAATALNDGAETPGDGDTDVVFLGGVPQLLLDIDLDGELEVVASAAISAGTASVYRDADVLSDPDADVVYVGGTARGAADLDGDGELEALVENGSGGATNRIDTVDAPADPDADVLFTGGRVTLFVDVDLDGELEAFAEDSAASPGSSTRDNHDGDGDFDVIFVAGALHGEVDLDGDGEMEAAATDGNLAGGTVIDPDDWDPTDNDADGVLVGIDSSPGSPSLILTAPNGGGSVTIGNPLTITWTASGFAGTVTIELSRDGGSTWETLFANTSNSGSVVWTSAGSPTSAALIRITSRNLVTPVSDTSNATFTLI